jgi:hypothetical protein
MLSKMDDGNPQPKDEQKPKDVPKHDKKQQQDKDTTEGAEDKAKKEEKKDDKKEEKKEVIEKEKKKVVLEIEYPNYWKPQKEDQEFFVVDKDSIEYESIVDRFQETMPNAKVRTNVNNLKKIFRSKK